MMRDRIEFEGLILREPLRSLPGRGLAVGLFTGLVFGAFATQVGFPARPESVFAGYVFGAAAAGLIVGTALPVFRNRIVAGGVVGASATVWGKTAMMLSGEEFTAPMMGFTAVIFGLSYAVLLWDYRGDAAESD